MFWDQTNEQVTVFSSTSPDWWLSFTLCFCTTILASTVGSMHSHNSLLFPVCLLSKKYNRAKSWWSLKELHPFQQVGLEWAKAFPLPPAHLQHCQWLLLPQQLQQNSQLLSLQNSQIIMLINTNWTRLWLKLIYQTVNCSCQGTKHTNHSVATTAAGMETSSRELGAESWRGWLLRLHQTRPPQCVWKLLLSQSELPWN